MLHKITILTLITIAFLGCKNKAEKAITKDALNVATSESNSTKYKANVTESVIQWTGFKPTGTHSGTIQIDSGNLTINKDQIESGTFIIDMTSIKDDDGSERLEGHLKSADFFDAEFTFTRNGIERDQIKMSYYEGGHMMYTHEPDFIKLTNDIRKFYTN